MNLLLILFLTGIYGFGLSRKNIILILISIEIMLLSILLVNSLNFYDIFDLIDLAYTIIIWYPYPSIELAIFVVLCLLIDILL